MNVLTSITVLGFLIFFHEMGHLLSAILQGIYVDGFSIGFGPSIIQKKYKDITYSFRAFPLGGFVSFPDVEINNIDPKDPNLLKNRPVFSVQYHPEANPGPQDSQYLFNNFIQDIKKYAKKKRY